MQKNHCINQTLVMWHWEIDYWLYWWKLFLVEFWNHQRLNNICDWFLIFAIPSKIDGSLTLTLSRYILCYCVIDKGVTLLTWLIIEIWLNSGKYFTVTLWKTFNIGCIYMRIFRFWIYEHWSSGDIIFWHEKFEMGKVHHDGLHLDYGWWWWRWWWCWWWQWRWWWRRWS